MVHLLALRRAGLYDVRLLFERSVRLHFHSDWRAEISFSADRRLDHTTEFPSTLRRIADHGADEFYTGSTADLIVAQMGRSPIRGMITRADLTGYRAVWRQPLEGDWHGFRVITAPPPSSGTNRTAPFSSAEAWSTPSGRVIRTRGAAKLVEPFALTSTCPGRQ